jgi:hypothetical protein
MSCNICGFEKIQICLGCVCPKRWRVRQVDEYFNIFWSIVLSKFMQNHVYCYVITGWSQVLNELQNACGSWWIHVFFGWQSFSKNFDLSSHVLL